MIPPGYPAIIVTHIMTRLLFIDDDPKAQDTLKMVLADDYQVISAFTGEQGIEIVREENPDVVLLDINLPDLDGLEVLEQIMAIPAPPPVVMLTVYPDVNLIVAAIKAEAYFRLYLFLVNDTVNINIQRSICDGKCPNRPWPPHRILHYYRIYGCYVERNKCGIYPRDEYHPCLAVALKQGSH